MKIKTLMLATLVACAGCFQAGAVKHAGHVVMIGFDAWGSYSVPKADMPTIKMLMKKGAYTLEKRTVFPSDSYPNWASMFMGAGPEYHGWAQQRDTMCAVPRVVNEHGTFPTIFSAIRESMPDAVTACVYDWQGIGQITDTLAMNHHFLGPDDIYQDDVTADAIRYIKEAKPTFIAVCYDNPDYIGHRAGHDTPEYYEVLRQQDARAARIIKAVEEAGILDDTVFLITADHGGVGRGHGGYDLREIRTPFIIAGKGIKAMGEFQECMIQYDVAATIAYALGVKTPQCWVGRPMTQVFE